MIVKEEKLIVCQSCGMMIEHHRNVSKINWVMHLCLMFVFGIGAITLLFAIVFNVILEPIFDSKHSRTDWYCTRCGRGRR